MDTATIITALGVVVAATVAIYELFVHLRERSNLQIIVEYYIGLGPSFLIILVKHGKGAISVEDIVLNLKPGGKFLYSDLRSRNIHSDTALQQTLQENNPPLRFSFPLAFLREDNTLNPLAIKQVEVITLSKQYKFPSYSLQSYFRYLKLKRQIKLSSTQSNRNREKEDE